MEAAVSETESKETVSFSAANSTALAAVERLLGCLDVRQFSDWQMSPLYATWTVIGLNQKIFKK